MFDEEREQLVLGNTKLVWYVVRKHYGRFRPAQQLELYHYGLEGLVKAARDYDPTRGVKFGTMAYSYIRNAVGHGVRQEFSGVYLPVYKRQAFAALLYGDDTPEGLAPDEVRAMQALGDGVLTLDRMAGLVGAPDGELEQAELRADVERMLDRLESREWYVIVHHTMHGEGLREVAEVLGVSKESVRNIETKALIKLREG